MAQTAHAFVSARARVAGASAIKAINPAEGLLAVDLPGSSANPVRGISPVRNEQGETAMEEGEIRRIVTGHDETGKAVVLFDGTNPYKNVRPGSGTVARLLWVTEKSPAEMSGHADRAATKIGIAPPAGGSVFRVVDFPPTTDTEIAKLDPDYMQKQIAHDDHGSAKYRPPTHPFMHRTRTVDYAVVMSGEIDMKLDEEEIRLRAGDVLVQQGTNHAWINRSGKPCRVAFVLIDAADPL